MNDPLDFEIDGAALHTGAALSILPALERIGHGVAQARAGSRLHGLAGLDDLLRGGSVLHGVASRHGGDGVRPVRAILFDKNARANWALGWHQDRTIAVAARAEVPGFGPWTIKQGIPHVEPPFGIIDRMVTIRVHLDDVPADNAPLLIARASHTLGRIPETEIEKIVSHSRIAACIASRGDVWAYATPILHASRAGNGTSRRVLQIDYSADALPQGLQWRGT